MSSVPNSELRMTATEYLEWERRQTERHEFLNGDVFLQSGGSRHHSLIGTNIVGEIRNALRHTECEVHGRSMRIHVRTTELYASPDASVDCPPIESESDDAICNPVLLVEALSPSTADYDRGGRFGHYRQIPSLKKYLVFWQDEPGVEQHQRTDDNLWLLREVVGRNGVLQLASLRTANKIQETLRFC